MRISDWSSDVCSSDLTGGVAHLDPLLAGVRLRGARHLHVRRRSAAPCRGGAAPALQARAGGGRGVPPGQRPVSRWIEETLHADFRLGLKADKVLFDSETAHQRVVLFENASFGRVLMLDGVVQTTERDEFRSEEHTSELQSLMRISYAVFC